MKKTKDMTLKEKLGQLLVVGFSGYEFNDHLRILIEDYKVANVILFARNIKDLKQLNKLNYDIHREVKKHTKTIPLITIDQEGGIVTRIMNGATFNPGHMTIGATEVENAYTIGKIMGEELSKLGVNMNLAPTLDVNNNPKNPVIGVRSFSDSPEKVAEFGNKFIDGLQEQGIIATAKHFPGHGDVEVDSHLGLPYVEHDKERLENVELFPFKKAIENGVDAIMSAHIVFKAYEKKDIPGTVSRNVITNLLRQELGFPGLIVSDCMEMKAIDDTFTTAKGVAMGMAAGLDLAFVSHTLAKQIDSLKEIEKAIVAGLIPMEEIDQKVERILKYKAKVKPAIDKNFLEVDDNLAFFADNKNHKIAQSIVDSSLTLVKGKDFTLEDKTLLLATIPYATTIAEDELDVRNILDAVSVKIPAIDALELPMKEIDENLVEIASGYDTVVICSYNAITFEKQAEMINRINKACKKVFVISTRNPYDILVLDGIKNYLCLYEYTPNAVKTIVKYLNGEIKSKGKLPVIL